MFPTYTDLAARQEQHQDRLRRAEARRLLGTSGLQPGDGRPIHAPALNWVGAQLIRLGAWLQRHGAEQPLVAVDTGAGCPQ